ncbi:MAG: glycosyltransferase [Phormidesmis sp.]
MLRLLLLSTPVGPIGSGLGGGVELTVANLAKALSVKGHQVTVVTPTGANLAAAGLANCCVGVVQIPGAVQKTAQTQVRSAPIVTSTVLANIWDYAHQVQLQYDLLVNFAYDWLPFYLTPFLDRPVAHFISMGSLSDVMDTVIAQTSVRFPGTLGAYTTSQVETFSHLHPLMNSLIDPPINPLSDPPSDPPINSLTNWRVLGGGLNLDLYDYNPGPGTFLAWVGRISPEKGLEDAIAAATAAHQPLKIFGKIEDTDYWQALQPKIEAAIRKSNLANPAESNLVEYCGFLPTEDLQKAIGQAQALLVTPHWIEAFGIVAIEALACGVPVIAYSQGGLVEIVQPGKTGYLVAPHDIDGLVQAIAKIDDINRASCRAQAEKLYSLSAWSRRFEQWFCCVASSDCHLLT